MSAQSKSHSKVFLIENNLSYYFFRDAKSKALNFLNKKKPQFPPDVYYIRRNPEMLNKFLENSEHIIELQ